MTEGSWASSGTAPAPPSFRPSGRRGRGVDGSGAAGGRLLVESDLRLGLLLAIEAHHIWPTPEAFRAIARGLERAEQKSLMATTDWGIASTRPRRPPGEVSSTRLRPPVVSRPRKDRRRSSRRPGVITFWDTSGLALAPAATIGAGELVSSLAFRPDARLLAAGSASSPVVKLWTAGDEAGPVLRDLGETLVTAVAFDASGRWLASGGQDGIIRLSREREPLRYVLARTLRQRHNGAVIRLAFSPRSSLVLASAGTDDVVALWHLDGDKAPVFLEGGDALASLAFSPDGQVLATAGVDATLRLWNAGTGESLNQIPAPAGLSAVAFKPDNTSVAVGDEEGRVRFYRRGRDWKQMTRISGDRDRPRPHREHAVQP